MSLRKGLARAGKSSAVRKGLAGVGRLLTLDNPEGWLSGEELVGLSRDRAMKISTVNRCVELLSTSMAVLPVYIMEERTKNRMPDHHLGRVLWERPNEAMTPFDFRRLLMCNQLLRGNAYAWIYRDAVSGLPLELIPLPPDYVSMHLDLSGKVWYLFTHPVTGEVTRIRCEDMLHYKAYSEDGLEGTSVLRRASLTLDTARAAQLYENSIWRNGGQPSGILTTETDLGGEYEVELEDGSTVKIDPKEQLRQSWEAIHSGPGNAFKVAILDMGLKYQPISMNNTDAQFVESSEIRVADVCRFFGVPLHLAYAGKQSYQSNEQNGIEYVTYTLTGYDTQWGQEDTYKLLLPGERAKGLRIKREMKVFLRGDTAAQAAWLKAMREIGAYCSDEIRALDDLPAIPGGKEYYSSLNYVPLELWRILSIIRALGKAAGVPEEPPLGEYPEGAEDPPVKEGEKTNE